MSEVFLMSADGHNKMLRFVQKKLLNEGFDCHILNSPKNALNKVKECFNLSYKNVPKLPSLRIADMRLNPEEYTLESDKKVAKEIKLRKKEYELLQFFIRNQNRIVNRNTILENVWGPAANPFTNTVDVHIASLRKKLNRNDQVLLKTIHGVGYKLVL